MQKILVVKVEHKPTPKGGMMTAVYDSKGTRFSGFLKTLEAINEGDTIEAEIEVDGKYNNITELKSIAKGTGGAPTTAESAQYREDPNKRASIEEEVGIQEIGRLMCARIPVPETARIAYWKWLGEKAHFNLSAKTYVAPITSQELPKQASKVEDEISWVVPDNSMPASETYQKATGKTGEPTTVKLITAEQLKELKEIQNTYKVKLAPYVHLVNPNVEAINKLTSEEADKVIKDIRTTIVK